MGNSMKHPSNIDQRRSKSFSDKISIFLCNSFQSSLKFRTIFYLCCVLFSLVCTTNIPFPSKRKSINHPSFSTFSMYSTVPRDSSNSSQDLILDEECVNDYPQDQSNDHRNEKDGLEKMPRAFHPWFCSTCPTLASTVFARNASWLHRRRSRHVAR